MDIIVFLIIITAIILVAATFRINLVINNSNCKQEVEEAKKNILYIRILACELLVLAILAFIFLLK